MTDTDLLTVYTHRHQLVLAPLADGLAKHITERLEGVERIDRIRARAKNPDRFLAKARKETNGQRKYNDPLTEIQDQIAARVTVFYLQDVQAVEATVKRYYRWIEEITVVEEPKKFGYEGRHLVLAIPEELFEADERPDAPDFFELQIKTLFQHAWSEAEHDLGYKSSAPLSQHQAREMAFTAAQAWGADQMFAKLFKELEGEP